MADNIYKIGGCDVKFPHKAYGTQLSFMSKVIQALEQRHNALLEAPTGSGKTLSLLCSALAWQQREKQRIEEGRACLAQQLAAEQAAKEGGAPPPEAPHAAPAPGLSPRRFPPDAAHDLASDSSISQDLANGAGAARAAAAAGPAAPIPDAGFLPAEHPLAAPEALPEFPDPPKIFYATRTHSQIAQVVRELKRSGFTPRMAVLASKQHYCVNKDVRNSPNGVQAACDELMKGGGGRQGDGEEGRGKCEYFRGVAAALEHDGPGTELHDIEDLTHAGATGKFCPYFLARKLATGADIVFGPYSYFIDPVVRRSMGVEVTNAVVIFDEAHNIEDVAREAASLELERQHAWETLKALARARQYNPIASNLYNPLVQLMGAVIDWMDAADRALAVEAAAKARGAQHAPRRFEDPEEKVVGGSFMLAELARMGLGPEGIDGLWEAYEAVRAADEEMLASGRGAGPAGAPGAENSPTEVGGAPKPAGRGGAVAVGAGPLGIVSRLIQVVRMLHQVSENGARDFRLVSRRAPIPPASGAGARPRVEYDDRSLAENDREMCGRSPPSTTHLLHLSLWCLNPSVAFRQVAEPARSVVLTSGTLSPLDSFASELGAPFQTRLEAPHVVNMARQVWAGVVPAAPDGRRLLATYAHTSQPEFLDSLGYTVSEACAAIPDGVLLFLPSYALLDRAVAQWQRNGVWQRLGSLKSALVVEPRRGGGPALQDAMDEFYGGVASGRGALMVAVCRGKVSEGLDFADANARGVLVVGIPFPNLKDKKVEAKREYNNEGSRTMGLLSGSVWYEQQAFRALNQAIGRCIRHRADWGSIVLIDERFGQAKTQRGLSKWVQRSVGVHRTFAEARASMGAFFARLAADPPVALPGPAPPAAPPARHGRTGGGAPLNALQLLMNGAKVEMDVLGEGEEVAAAPAPVPSPAERLTPADAAVRKAPLHSYVAQDLEFRAGLMASVFPGIPPHEAAARAVADILGAFDTAAAVAASSNPFHSWAGADGVMPPWGVIAVLSTVPHTVPDAVLAARHPSILDFAAVHLANLPVVTALGAMRGAYEEVFHTMGLGAAVEAARHRRAMAPVKAEPPGVVNHDHYAGGKRKREDEQGGPGPGWEPAGAGFLG